LKKKQKVLLNPRASPTLYVQSPAARTWGGKWDKKLENKALRAPDALLISVLGDTIVNKMYKVLFEPEPSRTLAGGGVSSPSPPNCNA
jgi:hypothetical protein